MECEFCKKIYSTKSNLTRHKQICKKAVVLRPIYICTGCNNIYKSVAMLNKHCTNCILYVKQEYAKLLEEKDAEKDKIIEEKDKIIAEKDKIIADIAKQPRNVTNNTDARRTTINSVINNLMPLEELDEDYIREQIQENLTANHVYDGQKGIANFTAEHLAIDKRTKKRTLVCTDPSRGTFCYKIGGSTVKEKGATPIISKIIEAGIVPSSKEKVNEAVDKIESKDQREMRRLQYLEGYMSIQNLESDGNEFASSLAKKVYSKSLPALTTEQGACM